MDHKLNTPWLALRLGIGLTATVAGMDKSFNLFAAAGFYDVLGAIAHASH